MAEDIRLRFVTRLEGGASLEKGLKGASEAFGLATRAAQAFARGVQQLQTGLSNIVERSNEAGIAMQGLAAVMGIGAGLALNTATGYETAMNKVKAVVEDASSGAMQQLIDKTVELGTTTTFSMTQAAQGMEFLAKAGYKTAQILETVPIALKLAATEGLPAEQVSESLVRVLNSFGMGADQAARAGDVLAKIANESTTSMSGLVEAMKFAAPIAAGLGMDIEETASYIGVLADRGIDATMAGTAVRRMMEALSDPTKEARNELGELGVELAKNADGSLNLTETFKRLHDANMSVTQSFKLFGTYGATAGVILARDIDKVGEFTDKARNADGALNSMYKTITSGLGPQTEVLKNALVSLMTTAITPLLYGLTVLVTYAASAAKALADFSSRHPILAGAIGSVVLAFTGLLSLFVLVGPLVTGVVAAWGFLRSIFWGSVGVFQGLGAAILRWLGLVEATVPAVAQSTIAVTTETAALMANTAAVNANATARASAIPTRAYMSSSQRQSANNQAQIDMSGVGYAGGRSSAGAGGIAGGMDAAAGSAGKLAGGLSRVLSIAASLGSLLAIGQGLSNMFSDSADSAGKLTGGLQTVAGVLLMIPSPWTKVIGLVLLGLTQFGNLIQWVGEKLGILSAKSEEVSSEMADTMGNWIKEGKGNLEDFVKAYEEAYGKTIPDTFRKSYELQKQLRQASVEDDKDKQKEMVKSVIEAYATAGKSAKEFATDYQKQFGAPPDALIKGAYDKIKTESKSSSAAASAAMKKAHEDVAASVVQMGEATGASYMEMYQKIVAESKAAELSVADQDALVKEFNKAYQEIIVNTRKAIDRIGKEWEAGTGTKAAKKTLEQQLEDVKQNNETQMKLLEQNQAARKSFLDLAQTENKARATETIASESLKEIEIGKINIQGLQKRVAQENQFAQERIAAIAKAYQEEKAILEEKLKNDNDKAPIKKALAELEAKYSRDIAAAEADSAKNIIATLQQLQEKRAEYAAQITKLNEEIWNVQRKGVEQIRSVNIAAASEYDQLKMKLTDANAKLKEATDLMPMYPERAKALAAEAGSQFAALAQNVDAAMQQMKSDTELIHQSMLKIQQTNMSPVAKWQSEIAEMDRTLARAYEEQSAGRIKEARALFQEVARKAPEIAQQAPEGMKEQGRVVAAGFLEKAGTALGDLNQKDIEAKKALNEEIKEGAEEANSIQVQVLESQKSQIEALAAQTAAIIENTQAILASKNMSSDAVAQQASNAAAGQPLTSPSTPEVGGGAAGFVGAAGSAGFVDSAGIAAAVASGMSGISTSIAESVGNALTTIVNTSTSSFQALLDSIPTVFEGFKESMKGTVAEFKEGLAPLADSSKVIKEAVDKMGEVVGAMGQVAATNSNITIQVQTPDGSAQYDSPFSL